VIIEPLTITNDSKGDWHRNIVSLRVSERLWDDLTDSPDVHEAIAALEAAYKPFREPLPAISRPFEESEIVTPLADVIDYPFEHPCASRFSEGRFGVWYGADSLETSIRETAYHWQRDERAIAPEARTERTVSIDRRVHLVECSASLVDLRPHVAGNPALVSNNYATCRRLAAELRDGRQPGVISESARNRGASVVGVFRRDALSNPRNVCYLTYELDLDTGRITVKRAPGKRLMLIKVDEFS
jgi:hypothetical protein